MGFDQRKKKKSLQKSFQFVFLSLSFCSETAFNRSSSLSIALISSMDLPSKPL